MRTSLLMLLVVAQARAATPEVDPAIDALNEHHRHHQHGGITQFVEMSLDTLGEDEAHRPAVEKAQDALGDCMAGPEEKETVVITAVADGVAAGTVDAVKVKAAIEQLRAAAEAIHGCVAPPMNELHAALAPIERAELGDKVRAHWAVWKEENHTKDPSGQTPGSRLGDLARQLSLTPDQVAKMAAALKGAFAKNEFQPEAIHKAVDAFAVAFAGEKFDATSVTSNTTAALAVQGASHMARFYETITPLLTAEQRTQLAAHLREHANHNPTASN